MQLKNRLKHRYRPFAEQLETRLTPAFTGVGAMPDGAGNVSFTGTTDASSFQIQETAPATLTITETGSLTTNAVFSVTGVFGNVTFNVATTNPAAFSGYLDLDGNSLLGNVSLTFSNASAGTNSLTVGVINSVATAGNILGRTTVSASNNTLGLATAVANVVVDTAASGGVPVSVGAVNLVGGLAVNTISPNNSTVSLNPVAASIINSLTVNETGGTLTSTKLLNVNSTTTAALTVRGGLTATGLDTTVVGNATAATVINGTVSITDRTRTAANATTFDISSTVIGNVTVKTGNNASGMTFNGAIQGALSAQFGNGTNTLTANVATTLITGIISINGANGTNTVNLGNTGAGNFTGSSIVITAGNNLGTNQFNLNGIQAGNAALTISVGNGNNAVHFGAGANLRSATLVGGFGTNTFDGTTGPWPFKFFRFF